VEYGREQIRQKATGKNPVIFSGKRLEKYEMYAIIITVSTHFD
jgi:hypothetical protein